MSQYGRYCKCESGGTKFARELPEDLERLFFRMNGPQLVKASLRPLLKMFYKLKQTTEKLDLCIPHQASPFALDLIQRRLDIPDDQFVSIVRDYGNMIAASIPFALHQTISSAKLQRGDSVMLFGTAAGLSIGGAIIEY